MLWTLLILLQIIIILCIVLVIGLFKLKKYKRLADSGNKPDTASTSDQNDLSSYLKSEADKTALQIEHISANTASKDSSGLKLRLELLKFEIAYLALVGSNRGSESEANWDDINLKIYKILKANSLNQDLNQVKNALGNNADEGEPSAALLEQQTKTIEHLKALINDLLNKASPEALPNNELDQHFSNLERANAELEQCVVILEDENLFLRDQVSALLKVQSD